MQHLCCCLVQRMQFSLISFGTIRSLHLHVLCLQSTASCHASMVSALRHITLTLTEKSLIILSTLPAPAGALSRAV